MCSLSWREPKQAQRPLLVNLDVLGPFQVLKPPITLRTKPVPGGGSDQAGPLVWWKLDEPAGSTATNAWGTKFAGQLHGQPRWTPDQGRFQGALELDGTNDWIECAGSVNADLRDSLSVSVWIKAGPVGKAGETLLAKGEAWQLQRLGGSGELEFSLSGPQAADAAKGILPRAVCKRPLADNQWHHVAAVYDGSRIALFVDGKEADSVKASGPLALNNLPVTLGGDALAQSARWHGGIDEVRIYGRGLSVEEIGTLQRGGL